MFTNISELLAYLHSPRAGDYSSSNAGELLTALIRTQATVPDSEVMHSVLVLAFAPTIHRTYREVRAWFRELEPEDIAQQVLTFFLELVASATVENLIALLPIALARSLRKNSFRWAEKEKRALLKRQANMQADTKNEEPAVQDQFETVFVLNDFLGYCCQIGVLSRFERELLIRFKVDGFSAKEIQDRHTALSERAVLIRVHRIMQRLQDVAVALSTKTNGPNDGVEQETPNQAKKDTQSVKHFSLKHFPRFLPISKSRRQLSLDSSPTRSDGQ
jgi:hypothetical protein